MDRAFIIGGIIVAAGAITSILDYNENAKRLRKIRDMAGNKNVDKEKAISLDNLIRSSFANHFPEGFEDLPEDVQLAWRSYIPRQGINEFYKDNAVRRYITK